MRNKILTALVVLALGLVLVPSTHAQWFDPSKVTAVGKVHTADDTSVAMVIRYIGAAAGGGEVVVAADGNIELTVATVADTTTECPVAAPLGGIIDVSDASCNTFGEVIDAINYSDNWRAYLVGAMRSETVDANTFLAVAITAADAKVGYPVYFDTNTNLTDSLTMGTHPTEFDCYDPGMQAATPIPPNACFAGIQPVLLGVRWYTTYGAGTSVLNVYSVKMNSKKGQLNAAGTGFVGGSETATLIYTTASGATTVAKEIGGLSTMPLLGNVGEKMIVRITNDTAAATVYHAVFGFLYSK
jgi:hypothetical protein